MSLLLDLSCLVSRWRTISCLTATYEIRIQNTELYNLNMPHDMRCLTVKRLSPLKIKSLVTKGLIASSIVFSLQFSVALNRLLTSVFSLSGINGQKCPHLIILKPQSVCQSSPFRGSLFLLISHLWNFTRLKILFWWFFSPPIGFLLPKVFAQNYIEIKT